MQTFFGVVASSKKGAPDAPTIGTVTVTNATTVSIPFTAGYSGTPILSYVALSSPSISLSVSGTTSPLTVTGAFASNTAYTFQIAAVNAAGTGAYSSASNSVTPKPVTPNLQYLVVAGGGGGAAGGGGGGGYRTASGYAVSSGSTYSVTVGAGGAGVTIGNSSAFDTISSTGGGAGGNASVGGNGGSGGGGDYGRAGGTGSQGNNGGAGTPTSGYFGGGGGGGAGAIGQTPINDLGGNGGNGLTAFNGGTYAGGGGGAASNAISSIGGDGGSGGGGNGSGSNHAKSNGVGGTGGGAGGGFYPDGQPMLGGSGIVVVRWANSYAQATSQSGASYANTGGYHQYTWTGSGSITI